MSNWRKVYKSDHLGAIDLDDLMSQGASLIFTIKEVKQEFGAKVAGKKGDFNIAYFKENIKPLVLNATNARIIRGFASSGDVENWVNIPVELYVDRNVKSVGGGITEGVRIKPIQPKINVKQKPLFISDKFESCHSKGVTVEQIKDVYELSPELEQQYINYCIEMSEKGDSNA